MKTNFFPCLRPVLIGAIAIAFTVTILSAAGAVAEPATDTTAPAQRVMPQKIDGPPTLKDVSYLGAERAEKLDVYLPGANSAGKRPAVLLIHGGGWRLGDKAAARERNIGTTLAAQGYVVFSINYLLNTGIKDVATGKLHLSLLAWPQNLHDCKSALRWIRRNATAYGVDPTRIAVMGGSAGGHLALMVGATVNDAETNSHGLYLDESNAISCIIDLYGDYDIRGRKVSPFAGATAAEIATYETTASPITYLDKRTPAMLILHGTSDQVIPVERSRLLAQHLRELGTDYCYVEIAGAPHSFDLQPKQMDLRPVVLGFLERHLSRP